jgi:D-beta-D-heptose 7-phosphate kinase/D-beta-D-heptose 1-phosphate adenosyltransferase
MRSPLNTSRKILSLAVLSRTVRRAQARGNTVVFTNGCFDLLHAGHVMLLERAKRLGDLLIVAINSDRSVRALKKGPNRPITPQRDRARILAALACVDYVTIFPEPTPQRAIEALQPDVLVKGADWGPGAIVGSDVVRRRHGRVVRLPLLRSYSTTRLIQRIQGL